MILSDLWRSFPWPTDCCYFFVCATYARSVSDSSVSCCWIARVWRGTDDYNDVSCIQTSRRCRKIITDCSGVNSYLVCDPTIRQPGFDLPWQQWSLLNRFLMEQSHCGACRRKWRLTDTDLCPCGETQTMYHIVESCALTKLNGGLSRLHSADEDAVSWLTNYGSWHAYEKKNWLTTC